MNLHWCFCTIFISIVEFSSEQGKPDIRMLIQYDLFHQFFMYNVITRNFNEKENSGILILSNIYTVFWINSFIFITGLHILHKIQNERIINGVIQIEQAIPIMNKFWIETVCCAECWLRIICQKKRLIFFTRLIIQ